jgi:membrane-associated phospholipid phosphatase
VQSGSAGNTSDRQSDPKETKKAGVTEESNIFADILHDQQKIWTSPFRIKTQDIPWIVPFVGTTAVLIASDNSVGRRVGTQHAQLSQKLSDAGLAVEFGAAGSFWVVGAFKNNNHARETGLLSYEAAVNSLAVGEAMKLVTQRHRPFPDGSSGKFFTSGDSFPSDHSMLAWSMASVIVHEYPGWGTRLLAYGTASAISAARVSGNKHHASDVFVGSALGWLIGTTTYRAHHDPDLPGVTWKNISSKPEYVSDPMRKGWSYVPPDSWVYAAFDRLAALGYVQSGFQNLRPWTRIECARLVEEAGASNPSDSLEVSALYRDLQEEFARDLEVLQGKRNLNAAIDSVYVRSTSLTGKPLTDGVHFGQTLINDYGRPYREGFSAITGISSHAEVGPLAFVVRGEYQHAPFTSALPQSGRVVMSSGDDLPIRPATDFQEINRFRLLDSYVALNLYKWQISFGKQSLWWGPTNGGDLMFSDNAEPITMLRLKRVTPFKLPGVLGYLGQMQSDTFFGQLNGYNFLRLGPTFTLTGSYDHQIDPQPFIWGQKLSLQPTRNLQIGVSVTTVFAGLGRPLTLDTFLHSLSFSGNGQPVEPGDRRTGFDFSYRIPGLRKWLVLYSGSMSEDEPNPIAYPRRSAMNPGVYLPQFPRLKNLDLHVEAAYTNLPNDPRQGVFYTNRHYANGYTNNGQIMASWLGPQARGYQVWSNYWRSGQSKIRFDYRKQVVDPTYIGGGTLQDFGGSYDFLLRSDVAVKAGIQYERWNFPVLSTTPTSNIAVSLQFTYRPGLIRRRVR